MATPAGVALPESTTTLKLRFCHPEQSKGSLPSPLLLTEVIRKIPRFARNDIFEWLLLTRNL
jgi:hypothetical protein